MRSSGRILGIIVLVVGVSAFGPMTATAGPGLSTPQLIEQAVTSGAIDRVTGYRYLAYAFADYDRLPAAFRSDVPWDGTLPLLHLQQAIAGMPLGSERRELARLLRTTSVLSSSCSSSSGGPNTFSSTFFTIEYGSIYGGLSINSYATSLDGAWSKEVSQFGWSAPPVKNSPPGGKYPVIITGLGGGLYGYVSNGGTYAGFVGDNPNSAWNDSDAYATCMVLNNDYSGFPGSPQRAMDATTAHEFNHSIQFGIGALHGSNVPDDAFAEGGATWMEDEVYDESNDNWNYLWPDFTQSMGAYASSPYPYWIVFRAITERWGTGTAGGGEQVMQTFWEETSKGTGDNLSAMQAAVAAKGTTLADAYHAAAIALKINKLCQDGYAYPYCLEEGPSYIAVAGATPVSGTIGSVGGSYNGSVRDDYSLSWIALPHGGPPYDITLHNTSGGGQLRASLLCDYTAGAVVYPFPAVVGAGQSTTLSNFQPDGCSWQWAVITNQFQSAADPSSSTSRSYTLSTSSGSGTPTISIGDASVGEGDAGTTSASFPVSLSPAAGGTVTVNYATASGSATSGTDFTSTSGTLTFSPGQTAKTILVPVIGDVAVEGDEAFGVHLTSPTGGATIGDGDAVGTIVDDDGSGGPPNDDFANAQVVPGGPCVGAATNATCTGSNLDASPQAGEPNPFGDGNGSSIWYRWTAPSAGTATIDTNGSAISDTVLGVYTGGGFPLSTVAEDDDSGEGFRSLVQFDAAAGSTYQIEVDSYAGGATGGITLHVVLVTSLPCPGYEGSGLPQIRGTASSETLEGTSASEVICGLGGDDDLFGYGGNDILVGGDGIDYLWGGNGNDTVLGGNGIDLVVGDAGNDTLNGGPGDDTLYGVGGNDSLNGSTGYDFTAHTSATKRVVVNLTTKVVTGEGTDTLVSIEGAAGSDYADILKGSGASNTIYGEAGNDDLYGYNANDWLQGDAGNDDFWGGPGYDACVQGTGTGGKSSCEQAREQAPPAYLRLEPRW